MGILVDSLPAVARIGNVDYNPLLPGREPVGWTAHELATQRRGLSGSQCVCGGRPSPNSCAARNPRRVRSRCHQS
eukprot:365779-Chlamydomonas_euryale.AAC.2